MEKVRENLNNKVIKILGAFWVLFHLFMLITSKNIFTYFISWNDFWFFNNWKHYDHYEMGYEDFNLWMEGKPIPNAHYYKHYDISEFTLYVLLPLFVFFAIRYKKTGKLLGTNLKFNSTKKDERLDLESQLKKLNQLKDDGLIDENDYKEMKSKILKDSF